MLGASLPLLLTALTVAVRGVCGNPIQVRTAYAVKETHRAPRKWTKMGRAPAETMMNLQIGVAQSQFPELERHLNEGVLEPLPEEYFHQLSARS
jgi:tripeptidyl-peptidase-1